MPKDDEEVAEVATCCLVPKTTSPDQGSPGQRFIRTILRKDGVTVVSRKIFTDFATI